MSEYIITIKNGARTRIENGPVKRFGNSGYGSRRKRGSFAPFLTWIDTHGLTFSSTSHTFYYPYFPDERWWLREGDIIALFVNSNVTCTLSNTMTTATSGGFNFHWTRWKEGDPTSLTVSIPDEIESASATLTLVAIRGAVASGDPFTAAQSSGSGSLITFPSVSASSPSTLVINAVKLASLGSGPDVFVDPVNESLDNIDIYYQRLGAYGIFVGDVAKPGNSGSTAVETSVMDSAWNALTVAVKGEAVPKRAVSGPHVSGRVTTIGTAVTTPLLIPNDIVVSYRITDTNATAPPSGWERLDGTPALSGSKYLHIFWRRWTETDEYYTYWSSGDLRHFSVIRHAAKSGNPFTASAVSTGNGTTATGPSISAAKDQLVFFATLLRRPPNNVSPFGTFTVSNVTGLEIDYDSWEASYVTPGYFRTLSAYSSGGTVGAFSQALNVSATDWFTVALAVRKA